MENETSRNEPRATGKTVLIVAHRTSYSLASSPLKCWRRAITTDNDMTTMQDVMALANMAIACVGGQDVDIRYNSRHGHMVTLETNEDVRMMMREWEYCQKVYSQILLRRVGIHRHMPGAALDPVTGVSMEIHCYPPEVVVTQEDQALAATNAIISLGYNSTDPFRDD